MFAISLAATADVRILKTPGYIIELDVQCEEGEVVCDAVRYRGTSLSSGRTLELVGKTEHQLCKDGVTPCRFLGYSFINNNVVYMVTDSGLLSVIRAGRVLLQQQGHWQK